MSIILYFKLKFVSKIFRHFLHGEKSEAIKRISDESISGIWLEIASSPKWKHS
jgi:hypothetical protein